MSIPAADARPAGFQLRWPPAGDVTITVRAPEDTLDETSLSMWVQSKALPAPDADEAIITATIGTVTQVTEGGTTFDEVTATFTGLDDLEQGVWYRLYLADGSTVWANGLVMGDNAGAESQSTTLAVSVAAVDLNLDLTVLSGAAGGGGGAPSGPAGGALSGEFPNPGLNVEAVQNLVGAMAGEGLTYDDVAGELRVTVEGGGGVQVLGVLHLTNLDLSSPHPLGAFLPPNTRLIQLAGQTNPAQNGTYRTPADPATQPLVLDDDQLLTLANSGEIATFSLLFAGASVTSGSYHFQVFADVGVPLLTVRHGVQWFAQWRYEGDPTEPVTIGGASFGHQVLVSGDPGDPEFDASTDGGLYVYQGAGQVMARSGVVARVGSMVYVMTEDTRWTFTPHAGWVAAGAELVTRVDDLEAVVDPLAIDVPALVHGDTERQSVYFPGGTTALRTPNVGDITGTFAHVVTFRVQDNPTPDTYLEFGSQTDDDEQHMVEVFESALYVGDPDGEFPPNSFVGTPELGKLYPIWESQKIGDTSEGPMLVAYDAPLVPGQTAKLLFEQNLGTQTARIAIEDPNGAVSAYGTTWDVLVTDSDPQWASLKLGVAEPWFVGWFFEGTIFDFAAYINGERVLGFDADDLTVGEDESFTDAEGNEMEMISARVIGAHRSQSIYEVERRVTVLEAAPSGSGDVVGPASSVDGRAALFDGTTGKLLKQASAAPVLEGDQRLAQVYAKAPAATAAAAYSNLGTFGTASTTHGLTAVNRRIWVPIYVLADTYTRIGVNVTTGAVSIWRLGLHADDGGFPAAAPLADYGTIDMSGSSGRRDIVISQALGHGYYWAQIQVDSFTATPTVTAVVGQSAQPPMPLGFPTERNSPTRGRASVRDTGGTGGALGNAPADLSVSGVSLESDAPRVWLWKA